MGIATVQSNVSDNNGTYTVTCTFTSAQTAGNTNIVYTGWDDTSASLTGYTLSDTSGNVYSLMQSIASNGVTMARWECVGIKAAAANANTVTLTVPGLPQPTPTYWELYIEEVSGTTGSDTTTGSHAIATNPGSALASAGPVTSSVNNERFYGYCYNDNTATGPGTGWTGVTNAQTDSHGVTGFGALLELQDVATSGTNVTATTPIGSSAKWAQLVFGLLPTIPPSPTQARLGTFDHTVWTPTLFDITQDVGGWFDEDFVRQPGTFQPTSTALSASFSTSTVNVARIAASTVSSASSSLAKVNVARPVASTVSSASSSSASVAITVNVASTVSSASSSSAAVDVARSVSSSVLSTSAQSSAVIALRPVASAVSSVSSSSANVDVTVNVASTVLSVSDSSASVVVLREVASIAQSVTSSFATVDALRPVSSTTQSDSASSTTVVVTPHPVPPGPSPNPPSGGGGGPASRVRPFPDRDWWDREKELFPRNVGPPASLVRREPSADYAILPMGSDLAVRALVSGTMRTFFDMKTGLSVAIVDKDGQKYVYGGLKRVVGLDRYVEAGEVVAFAGGKKQVRTGGGLASLASANEEPAPEEATRTKIAPPSGGGLLFLATAAVVAGVLSSKGGGKKKGKGKRGRKRR